MFRKSDYLAPQLHPTYAKKPPSEFQMMSQLAEFDDGGRRRAAVEDEGALYGKAAQQSVPATYDTVYAPQNPGADWGGLVDKNMLPRKHCSDHKSQKTNIVQSEHGLVGAENKKEYARVNRIDWGHGDHSEEPLIGGTVLPDQYKTVYKQQQLGEGTTRDQLSLMKRTQKPVPDKPKDDRKPQRSTMQFKENFSNEAPQRSISGTRSLIADLGEALVHIAPDAPSVRRKNKK